MAYWQKDFILAALLCQAVLANAKFSAIKRAGLKTLTNCTRQDLLDLPDVTHIDELLVQDCDIPELENTFFRRYTSLTALEISESGLSRLADYALQGLKHLRVLSLAHNNISDIQSWSNENLSALIALDLRHNAIRTLSLQSFVRYPNLLRLNLARNELEYIEDGIFRWMPQLKQLDLGHNRLQHIDEHYFHGMQRLAHLALSCNAIANVAPSAFATNSHLRSLKLEGNQLVDLEFMMVNNLVRLVHLNLSHNAIASLERLSFDSPLTDLDLSYNELTTVLAGPFAKVDSLEHLNISHNSIHTIAPHSFVALSSVQFIDLAGNNLSELPAELFGTELKRADLSLNLCDNRFAALNISALMSFQRVELAGNRWSCSWLISEILRTPRSINFGRNHSVLSAWSNELLAANGIACEDGERQRSVILVDTAQLWQQRPPSTKLLCPPDARFNNEATAMPVPWPKLRLDRFDSRSVIIWMLIGIGIAFSALRIARRIIDHKERKKRVLLRKQKGMAHGSFGAEEKALKMPSAAHLLPAAQKEQEYVHQRV